MASLLELERSLKEYGDVVTVNGNQGKIVAIKATSVWVATDGGVSEVDFASIQFEKGGDNMK